MRRSDEQRPITYELDGRQYIRVITLRLGFAAASCRAEALIVVPQAR